MLCVFVMAIVNQKILCNSRLLGYSQQTASDDWKRLLIYITYVYL